MTLIRRCPDCKGKEIEEALVPSRHSHGGCYWAVKCVRCNKELTFWEIVDEPTDTTIATAGDNRAVIWRKRALDKLGRMSGRNSEGMAI